MSASALPTILKNQNYVIHQCEWYEPYSYPGNPLRSRISVSKKLGKSGRVLHLVNIVVCNKQIQFYAANGHQAKNSSISYSTYLKDKDENKFILDFKRFIKEMTSNPRKPSYAKAASEFMLMG